MQLDKMDGCGNGGWVPVDLFKQNLVRSDMPVCMLTKKKQSAGRCKLSCMNSTSSQQQKCCGGNYLCRFNSCSSDVLQLHVSHHLEDLCIRAERRLDHRTCREHGGSAARDTVVLCGIAQGLAQDGNPMQ